MDSVKSSGHKTAELIVGALALVLTIATIVLSGSNAGMQKTVATNQAKLAKQQTLANVDNSLVQLLAKAATEKNDTAIRSLLSSNGVTVNAAPAAVADATPATPAGDGQ